MYGNGDIFEVNGQKYIQYECRSVADEDGIRHWRVDFDDLYPVEKIFERIDSWDPLEYGISESSRLTLFVNGTAEVYRHKNNATARHYVPSDDFEVTVTSQNHFRADLFVPLETIVNSTNYKDYYDDVEVGGCNQYEGKLKHSLSVSSYVFDVGCYHDNVDFSNPPLEYYLENLENDDFSYPFVGYYAFHWKDDTVAADEESVIIIAIPYFERS